MKLEQHLKSTETKIKNLRKKFAFDEIDKETFQVALADLEEQKETLQNELSRTVEDLSNLGEFTSIAIAISCKLGELWKQMDFEVCQKIQKLIHPLGIVWDKEKGCYRTLAENSVFEIFRSISEDYKCHYKEKADNSFELSALVAGGGLEPPTFGL